MSEKKGYDYRKGFSVNAKANPTSAEAKAPFIDNGSGPISPKDTFLRRDETGEIPSLG